MKGTNIVYVETQNSSPQTAPYAACPNGTTLVGYYHTHPDGHNFSNGDKEFVKGGKIPLYMSYDDKRVQRLDPWMTDDAIRVALSREHIDGGIPLDPKLVEVTIPISQGQSPRRTPSGPKSMEVKK